MPDPSTKNEIALYADARVYDILHTPGTAAEVRDLERIAARYATARGNPLWLEPACGSGRYLREAAGRGTRCIGFDLDRGMVRYAQNTFDRRSLPARAFCADMTDFTDALGRDRATFAFNTINTIRHLPSDAAMLRHLEQVGASLRAGGIYLVGLSLASYGLEFPSEDVWAGGRGRCRVEQVVQYQPADRRDRIERVYSVVSVATPSAVRHEPSSYALRTYSPEQWDRLISKSAMRLVASIDETGEPREPESPGYNLFVLAPRE